mmetsp:Transcript_18966/g.44455  ORF Transcript_18966/g.44455 Transcript_18966/m.44455 type:complete len:139 (-) Transcript_18966:165-581(-)|eukprot:CAMPEP_0114558874 /NCGR_PEP_ID=MMETSP0114-20121206/10621_1 /TAXON_ID=31324 /ORGANISM="Goniomonas sp, Strain m" /LENGTH=138 /DNA_ID=CAMNT_0001744307 /DNA_START=12 /DNA_END=428 /DNA_ORIENTATION=-
MARSNVVDVVPPEARSHPASSLTNPDKAGNILRRSKYLHMWKSRHVVLKNNLMYWFANEQSGSPDDVVSLKNATGVRREETGGRNFAFVVSFGSGAEVFAAADSEEMEGWLRAVGRAIVRATTAEWDDTSDRIEEQQS